jgi:serine/threonine protein phosphatase PrpC
MVVCPNCKAENRSGAKFCKNCATRLPTSTSVTRPLDEDVTALATGADPEPETGGAQVTRRLSPTSRTGTQPLQTSQTFARRPMGAIFGDNFLYENVIFSDDIQHRYKVKQIDVAEDMQIRVCPNPTCGAVFPPRSTAPEKYCTDCGTVLERGGNDLVLIEARSPIPDNVVRTAAKGLSNGNVRAPLAAFVERLAGLPRHCLVMTPVNALERSPDTVQALKWGAALAHGLDYLHDNGIAFEGKIDPSMIGLVGERLVWANFTASCHHPEGYVTERQADAQGLAKLVFHWLTGKTQFEHDPNLTPGVNRSFEIALASPGVANGGELAEIFDRALEEMSAPQAVDFRLGRRTHVGMVRTLNEDSILTLEVNRIQQSVSQPLGVFAVADGMGGHAAGEIASGTIVNAIAQHAIKELIPDQIAQGDSHDRQAWLRGAVEAANAEVFALRKAGGTDMGSTLVVAALEGNKAYIAHVGDSRAYLINSQGIERLTIDHSLVERLIATNQITREEARYHPQRNVIYRTVGDKAKIDVEISVHMLAVGDYLLLCSDGMSGMVEDKNILKIVMEAPSPQAACDELINAANKAGGEDNVSVILVKIVQP